MLKRVHHLAVLVRDLDRAMALYRDTFGLRLIRRMLFVERNVDVALFDLGGVPPPAGLRRGCRGRAPAGREGYPCTSSVASIPAVR